MARLSRCICTTSLMLAALLISTHAISANAQDPSQSFDVELDSPQASATPWQSNSSSMMQTYSPAAGFTIGAGGSLSTVNFKQNLDASGVSDIYSGSTLVAYGEAGGPSNPFHEVETILAPTLQLGYLHEGLSEGWLWGAKGTYKYLNVTTNQQNINSPQFGSFTNTNQAPNNTTFTGHVIIGASQTTIDHQLSLIPFIGHAIDKGWVYFGAGPTVFGTETNIYDAYGFAALNGVHYDITGQPIDFSNSPWMWGAAAQVGMVYQLDSTWFVELSYEFAITGKHTISNSSPFATTAAGYNDIGILYVESTQRIMVGSLTASINRAF